MNNEFLVRVEISDNMLDKLEESLTRKKRKDKPKEEKKGVLLETMTRIDRFISHHKVGEIAGLGHRLGLSWL